MTQVGDLFSDRYTIERLIARGGMADVFLARDQSLSRPVAVKILFPEFARDPSFVERFRREAQHAASLHHPNIVAVYDYGQERSTYFIVMEYVEGQSLRDLIHGRGPIPPMQAARITSEIAAALEFADRHGVVHRDIKPGNVLITPTGDVKVTDFGIAANPTDTNSGLTQTGAVIGTATYFSPEQAQGFPVDGRSDVYSLGVVLYEMLTGHPPFVGDSPVAVAMKHVREEPASPRLAVPTLAPALEAITLTALAKDLQFRYPSAGEMRADLLRFGRGQPVLATPFPVDPAAVAGGTADPAGAMAARPRPAPGPRSREPRRQRSGTVVAVIVSVLLAIAVIGGLVGSALGAFTDNSSSPPKVEVPAVVGQTFVAAQAALAKLGFKVAQVEEASDSPIGQVTTQRPENGVLLAKGRTVTLSVSSKQVTVPDLVGKTFPDAQAALSRIGLVAQRVDQPSTQPAGTVLGTTPAAGAKLDKGSTVPVAVSAEPTVAIPNVNGLDQAAGQAQLEAAGFVVQVVPAPSTTVPPNRVIATDPTGGSMAPKGTTVRMSVSTGVPHVTVPGVTGQICSSGAATLTGAGFGVVINGTPSHAATAQSPAGGATVDQGSTVTLTCP